MPELHIDIARLSRRQKPVRDDRDGDGVVYWSEDDGSGPCSALSLGMDECPCKGCTRSRGLDPRSFAILDEIGLELRISEIPPPEPPKPRQRQAGIVDPRYQRLL